MEDKYKDALQQVLMNLRCIDVVDNAEIDSYVDDSIKIIKSALEECKWQELV